MNPVVLGSQYWLIVMHRGRYTRKNLDETCWPRVTMKLNESVSLGESHSMLVNCCVPRWFICSGDLGWICWAIHPAVILISLRTSMSEVGISPNDT
jgi:hypothetical protein